MRLEQLLKELPVVSVQGSVEREIAGLTYDSRRVTPGMVFVAVPGRQTDGHDYVANAIERGAAAVICEHNGFVPYRATQIRVADSRQALARAAAAFYGHPSTRLQVIGVTGTHGKTTVAFMIHHLLEAAGVPTGLISSIHYQVGDRVIPAQRTTPEALETQQMLAAMVRAGARAGVMEVSSHALDQHRVEGVQFDVGVFTNLGPDHLDYHGSMAAYFGAKQKLFSALREGAKRGWTVVNIDDNYGCRLAREAKAEVLLTYGLGESARLRASSLQLGRQATRMVVETPRGKFDCRLPLIGRYNVYNALAAIGAALSLELPLEAIRDALNRLPPIPGRLEGVDAGQPFGVFVDYAHSAEALRQTLLTLREATRGRVLLAFGCGGTRDVAKRPAMGRLAAELADFTIVTSDNPRREAPDRIAAQIEAGYRCVREGHYRIQLDRQRAIAELLRQARAGDSVLIAGKGHETYQEFEDTVVPFDDRVQAREGLAALGFTRPSAHRDV